MISGLLLGYAMFRMSRRNGIEKLITFCFHFHRLRRLSCLETFRATNKVVPLRFRVIDHKQTGYTLANFCSA